MKPKNIKSYLTRSTTIGTVPDNYHDDSWWEVARGRTFRGDERVEMSRVRLVDGKPCAVARFAIPAALLEEITGLLARARRPQRNEGTTNDDQ